jgi:hypothetical protein
MLVIFSLMEQSGKLHQDPIYFLRGTSDGHTGLHNLGYWHDRKNYEFSIGPNKGLIIFFLFLRQHK